jgi:hypothetical protein
MGPLDEVGEGGLDERVGAGEEGGYIPADDGNSGHHGYADGDNAYHDDDYFHTETNNDDAGVVQDLRAHYDNQMNDYGNSLEACYMVNVVLDDMESGVDVDTIDAFRGMEVDPHPTSSVN